MELGSEQAIDLLRVARGHCELLTGAATAKTQAGAQARVAFEKVRQQLVETLLAQIDLEQLKTVTEGRLRLEPLRSAGFNTVSQLLSAGLRRLQALPGVTPATATKVFAAAQQLSTLATKNLSVRIDPKTRPDSHQALLQAVQRQEKLDQLLPGVGAAFPIVDQLARLTQEAALASKGPIRRFLARRSKRVASLQALESLAALVESDSLGSALVIARQLMAPAAPADVWIDFIARAADYFIYLTRLGVAEADAASATGNLPQHIVEAVRSQPLDESLLQVSLRGYQAFGARYALVQRKTLLGDEMGLGKTVEALAVLAHLTAQDQTGFLVVCPAAVVLNWTQEIQRKSKLTAVMIHGPAPERTMEYSTWRNNGGVGVMSYETARVLHQAKRFDGVDLALAVVDEAHFVKNRDAQRSRAVASIIERCERVLFMSGTPLENRVDEFESLVSYLQPDIAPQLNYALQSIALIDPSVFRQRVAPVYLRRNQQDVLHELPERIDSDEWLSTYPAEQLAYDDAVRAGNWMAMRRAITIGNGEAVSAKLDRLAEIIEQASEEGQRVIVFSYFRDVISAVVKQTAKTFGPIHGSVPPLQRQTIIDHFSAAAAPAVLVAQIQAGGTGLNIQAASVVVLMEPQVKPSLESQAIGRAHRMGQTRRVQVFRLLASDSVDERMIEILTRKARDFDAYARESSVKDATPEATDISDTRLAAEVIALEQQRLAERELAALLAGPHARPGGEADDQRVATADSIQPVATAGTAAPVQDLRQIWATSKRWSPSPNDSIQP